MTIWHLMIKLVKHSSLRYERCGSTWDIARNDVTCDASDNIDDAVWASHPNLFWPTPSFASTLRHRRRVFRRHKFTSFFRRTRRFWRWFNLHFRFKKNIRLVNFEVGCWLSWSTVMKVLGSNPTRSRDSFLIKTMLLRLAFLWLEEILLYRDLNWIELHKPLEQDKE